MKMWYVIYVRGGVVWRKSPYMTSEDDAVAEAVRFNRLPLMLLSRAGMTARVCECKA